MVTGVVLGALVLAGCGSGQSTAGNYADLEDNFIESCEATLVEDAAAPDSGAAEVPEDFCQCAFDELSDGESAVEFDRLMEVNDELRDERGALPDEVTEAFAGCRN
jgi:hypothetical protein